MNISEALDRAARHFADRPAVIFEGETLTYARLRAEVDRAAHGLEALQVRPGDRVALFLPNIPAFVIAYEATQKVGAIAVSVNTMLTTEELHHVLTDSGAGTVFTTSELLPRLLPLVGRDVAAERVIVCEGDAGPYMVLQELGSGYDGSFRPRRMDRNDPAAILYTSGTTGKQKGAVLSHGNVVSNIEATAHALRIDPDDRLLLFLPLFHCFGQNFILNSAFAAGAAVVMHRRFVPETVLSSIRQESVTLFFAVPAVYIGLLNAEVDLAVLASVRYYFSAAATLPIEVADRWRERTGHVIHEGYGLTETSPFASYNHQWEHRPGSVGTPIEMVEMRVVGSDDDDVAAGEWGEILIKGPNVMLGYWNRAEETDEALRGGWFHTGDIGYRDEDDYVYLVDRVKDMINAGGYKIWPREVEEVLYAHPAVAECAVVGMPDRVKGEATRAVIVTRVGMSVRAEELEGYCRQHLAIYKVPQRFDFVAGLPKSATGKILKRVLRADDVGGRP